MVNHRKESNVLQVRPREKREAQRSKMKQMKKQEKALRSEAHELVLSRGVMADSELSGAELPAHLASALSEKQ